MDQTFSTMSQESPADKISNADHGLARTTTTVALVISGVAMT